MGEKEAVQDITKAIKDKVADPALSEHCFRHFVG